MKVNLININYSELIIFFGTALIKLRGTSDVSEDIEEMRVCFSPSINFTTYFKRQCCNSLT